MDLNDPTTVALLAAEAFQRAGFPHAIYGGLLTAAYGEPRETRDADFAVASLRVGDAVEALRWTGLETRVSFEDVIFGGLAVSRMAILGSAASSGLNTIDLVRPRSLRYAQEALARAPGVPLRHREVKVLTPEDFLLFKALSTRERDLEDAVSVLLRSRGALDLEWVGREVGALAVEIPDIDVQARYERIRQRAGTA